jgi:hypothetical protein
MVVIDEVSLSPILKKITSFGIGQSPRQIIDND